MIYLTKYNTAVVLIRIASITTIFIILTGRHGVLRLLVGGWGGTEGTCHWRGHRLCSQLHHDGASLGVGHQRLFGLLEKGLGHASQERTAAHYYIHNQQRWWRWLSRVLKEKEKTYVKRVLQTMQIMFLSHKRKEKRLFRRKSLSVAKTCFTT